MRVTVEEHQGWIIERVGVLPATEVLISLAHGLTLAEPVSATHALPLWDNSAMDGYALHAADTAQATTDSPTELRVVGEVLAGGGDDPEIPEGSAVRIMTGAPVPSTADAVIQVERTRGDRRGTPWAVETVQVLAPVDLGENIRRQGEDVAPGGVVATKGQVLSAARIAALAAAGVDRVAVHPLPRVAVIITGAELRAPGESLLRGQIPESNSLLLVGLLRELGIEAVRVVRCSDDARSFASELRRCSEQCDVVITTGGVGPGSHDVVRIALEQEPEVRAVRVAVRPGQPQCAGRLRTVVDGAPQGPDGGDERAGAFLFALPGNPVSAAVSFELFVRPALLALQGRAELHRLGMKVRVSQGWRGGVGRLQVLPVIVSAAGPAGLVCAPAVHSRGVSHAVGGHGTANAYALVEAERGDVLADESVTVIMVAP